MLKLDEEQMYSLEWISKRWDCHYSTVFRRLCRHKAKVYRFSRTAVRVPMSEILRVEAENAETLAAPLK
jgi:hypothetical protein